MVHPVLGCIATVESAVKDVADVNPGFMSVEHKKAALLGVSQVIDRLEELKLRVLATCDDVALEEGDRDAGAWLAHVGRRDRGETRRSLLLAEALDTRWCGVARGLGEGVVNLAQAEVIVRALDALPGDLDPEIRQQAEALLVAEAAEFGPRSLRILGRRVLDVVAPELVDAAEGEALEREEREAARRTFLRFRRRGDGTTDINGRLADSVADRLRTYLDAFTSPRKAAKPSTDQPSDSDPLAPQAPPSSTDPGRPHDDRRPYDQRLGHAFGAFLEAVDPARLPIHGGDATVVMVTVELTELLKDLGVALIGDEPISAAQARRLACNAHIIPAVLGTDSEVLDLGKSARLFTAAQRRAHAKTHPTCQTQGCDIPAAWCEAHHGRQPWAAGGTTDRADLVFLCPFHHHRAHDHRYDTRRHPDGAVSFHRRT